VGAVELRSYNYRAVQILKKEIGEIFSHNFYGEEIPLRAKRSRKREENVEAFHVVSVTHTQPPRP
jgi:hypothetical protein